MPVSFSGQIEKSLERNKHPDQTTIQGNMVYPQSAGLLACVRTYVDIHEV